MPSMCLRFPGWLLLALIVICGVAIIGSLLQMYEGWYYLKHVGGIFRVKTVHRIGTKLGRLQPTQLHERASMLKNSLNLDC